MIRRIVRDLGVLLAGTAVLLLAVNLVLALVLPEPYDPWIAVTGKTPYTGTALERAVDEITRRGTWARLQPFHPQLSLRDITQMMVETYGRSFLYEPFTGFTERPLAGRFVRVDPHGFRLGATPAPWPPPGDALTVFVFGGSTTFGHSVTDAQTIPAQLEALLAPRSARPLRVYNFGRQFYFSSQERALLETLLLAGVQPDVAVFVDGLNDFYFPLGEPQFTADLRRFMDHPPPPAPHPLLLWLQQLPIGRAAALLRPPPSPAPAAGTVRPPTDTTVATARAAERAERRRGWARQVEARWLANKRMTEAICARFGVRPLFVWQPVPKYAYDRALQPFLLPDDEDPNAMSALYGYPAMAQRRDAGELGDDFVWCADLAAGLREAVYLDQVHYTPRMNRRVARCIAKGLRRQGLVPRRPRVNAAAATTYPPT